jgi:hypothetical protein
MLAVCAGRSLCTQQQLPVTAQLDKQDVTRLALGPAQRHAPLRPAPCCFAAERRAEFVQAAAAATDPDFATLGLQLSSSIATGVGVPEGVLQLYHAKLAETPDWFKVGREAPGGMQQQQQQHSSSNSSCDGSRGGDCCPSIKWQQC